MSAPEFLICLNCENPTYVFECKDGEVTEVVCEICGAEDPDEFATPDDFDAMSGGG